MYVDTVSLIVFLIAVPLVACAAVGFAVAIRRGVVAERHHGVFVPIDDRAP